MSETAAHIALVQTASDQGVASRRRHIFEHGPCEIGWSYANIRDVSRRLSRQIEARGFFRLYLLEPDAGDGSVRHAMRIGSFRTFDAPEPFLDPVDRRRHLVHSVMKILAVEDLPRPIRLEDLRSVDDRRPDVRHLQLGFLFVVDPEA